MREIKLNFIEIDSFIFTFPVYARPYNNKVELNSNQRIYNLPDESDSYKPFIVQLEKAVNFKRTKVTSTDNVNLTSYYLFSLLRKELCNNSKKDIDCQDKGFSKFIEFTISEHKLSRNSVF